MIYLDHSATTPIDKEVFETMLPYLKGEYGNASTVYKIGREAKKAMNNARSQVASLISADSDEIIFTGGGTESDNIAIKGIACKSENKGKHIITSNIEHPAVKETCEYLENKGFKLSYIPVDKNGIINPKDVESAITNETILITIMHVNNEIGTIQPIAEIGRIANEKGILFHCDAVQSVGKIPVNVGELGVDLLSISSHKIYGPKGVGGLYIKKGLELEPILHGGGQEKDLNPGTENIAGIVGFGKACEISEINLEKNVKHVKELREKVVSEILEHVDSSYLNGDRANRLPGNANFIFPGVEGEGLILKLDLKGICVSTGSACSSNKHDTSHVLNAIGVSGNDLHSSIRLTLGPENTKEEIDIVIKEMIESIKDLRNISLFWDS